MLKDCGMRDHRVCGSVQGPSAVQQAPEPHHEDLHPHMGLAGDLGMVQAKRYSFSRIAQMVTHGSFKGYFRFFSFSYVINP